MDVLNRAPPLFDRFATIHPAVAALLLGAAVLLMMVGLLGAGAPGPPGPRPGHDDVDLYAHFVDYARHPATFYAASIAEQRREHYPLRPAITVRPPALAFFLTAFPDWRARRLAFQALVIVVMTAWGGRLAQLGLRPMVFAVALLAAGSGILAGLWGRVYLSHEGWTGLLIALSLALHRPKAWAASLALGLAAVLVRELAAPYLLVMALFAWIEGRRGEASAWLIALAAFAAALAGHAWAVSRYVLPGDLSSPGWLSLGGWPFVLQTGRWNILPMIGPGWLSAVLAPLALLGAIAWPGPTGARLGLTVVGFTAAFLFVGRPDNAYWGLMTTPLVALGLAMAPSAIFGLVRRLAPTAGRTGLAPTLSA